LAWIAARTAEGPVYIHCAMGHGRSGSIVIAHLVRTNHCETLDDAIEHVKTQRPGVDLHDRQKEALRQLLT
jgi:protein-tyrosine phosphatase